MGYYNPPEKEEIEEIEDYIKIQQKNFQIKESKPFDPIEACLYLDKKVKNQNEMARQASEQQKKVNAEITAKEDAAVKRFDEFKELSQDKKIALLEEDDFLLNLFKDAPFLIKEIDKDVFNFGRFEKVEDRNPLMEEIITTAYMNSSTTRFWIDNLDVGVRDNLGKSLGFNIHKLKENFDKEKQPKPLTEGASATAAAGAAAVPKV